MIHFLLNIVVFISGAVLMGLEIVGSRVLAPYFGNSIFVWGSLISVVLAALSVGYYWGGWLSERNPSFARFLGLLVVPGIMIFLLPFVYPAINLWIAGVDFGIRLNPLIASTIFFLIPGIFLGTISPYAIRLAATTLSTVGSTAGSLYALSTCGSIFGTLFTAFYLIPAIGVSNIIHALGLTLLFLSVVLWPLVRVPIKKRAAALAAWALSLVALSILASASLASGKIIFEKDSFYHNIRVEEDSEARYLYFDRTLQSAMNLDDFTSLRLLYSRYASVGLAFKPDAKKLFVIGLGGGSIPKKYQREFPSLEIDVAEIDPEVIQVAKKYFALRESKNLRVFAQDGRLFLMRTQQRYDLIMLDAYFKDSIPFHLTTREFFKIVDQRLTPRGIMVANIIGGVTGRSGRITRSVAKTLREIFPQIYLFPTLRARNTSLDTLQNVIIVATKDPQRVDIQEITKRAASLGRDLFPTPLKDLGVSFYDAKLPDQDVPVLTDDYAPTDDLLHP
ncbi:MAG TPA: fused MFS/spermidine synthase [Candidatus Binatia bacterium]|jgi:spermidine synthase|nr:fused MFS/spermidine synthase [Candidatus Binatia bacterium]